MSLNAKCNECSLAGRAKVFRITNTAGMSLHRFTSTQIGTLKASLRSYQTLPYILLSRHEKSANFSVNPHNNLTNTRASSVYIFSPVTAQKRKLFCWIDKSIFRDFSSVLSHDGAIKLTNFAHRKVLNQSRMVWISDLDDPKVKRESSGSSQIRTKNKQSGSVIDRECRKIRTGTVAEVGKTFILAPLNKDKVSASK